MSDILYLGFSSTGISEFSDMGKYWNGYFEYPWFVYDEDIFTPKELDNFKKSYAKALEVSIGQIEEEPALLRKR